MECLTTKTKRRKKKTIIVCKKKKAKKKRRVIIVRTSAFRAVNATADQTVTANTPVVPVQYPNQIFDINNEYDTATSTFTPKQDGIYFIIASVSFFPDDVMTNYRLVLNIRVNDFPIVTDDEFFGANPVPTGDQISVSGILKLEKGDKVTISLFPTTDGIIVADPRGTHFEASRLTSIKH
ncbi:hypothetical protein ACFSL6_04500 [Paenibacillus thailandensis]|uniref:C1q domain-containing protein n=1 Tax=Paenibacillus thailandensis TaxID=393250 RepID=A0ABW5QZM3_9BACL